MTTATYIYNLSSADALEVEYAREATLTAHLQAESPSVWLWCLNCERSFRLGDVQHGADGASCGYGDCAGEPLDFWTWDAYRAFVGAAPQQPEAARRYPLAA